MRKIVISALLTSSTLVMLADSVFAKDCPPLDIKEITAIDSGGIALRTDPTKKEQDKSKLGGTRAVVNTGDKLLILSDKQPQLNSNEKTCYYPVELGNGNQSNIKKEVLEYKPYWISEKGIQNYDDLPKKKEKTPEGNNSPETNGDEKDPQDLFFPSWLPWVLGLNLLSLPLLVLLTYWANIQRNKIKDITSTLGDITNSLYKQNLKFGKELQDIQGTVGSNKKHIKQLEESINQQNKHLDNLVDYIKSENLSKSISDSLEKTIEVMLESRQSEQNKPGLAPASEQNEASQQETEQTEHYDPFYDQVILQFNTASDSWFSSLIEQRKFGKVQITKDSVLGQMDMGGKVTQLKLNEQGTLLIYQAADKFWIIPDLTQSKWKRAITDSLFNGSGQMLVRPAEVELVGNHLWQVKEKGEFS